MIDNIKYSVSMTVGLIQTDLCSEVAWDSSFSMDVHEERRSWAQVKSALKKFKNSQILPDIIVLPELAISPCRLSKLKKYSSNNGSIIISGLDYTLNDKSIKNQCAVIIPPSFKGNRRTGGSTIKLVDKIYPAPTELDIIMKKGKEFISNKEILIFSSEKLGRFGVTICYDLMDLERALIYRTQVQHLFVLAYNKDIDSFYHLAESLCRTLYCNVVICNTGFYGGSLAIKPFKSPWVRVVYRHEGQGLDTAQIIELPVLPIINAQKSKISPDNMKSLPPGF